MLCLLKSYSTTGLPEESCFAGSFSPPSRGEHLSPCKPTPNDFRKRNFLRQVLNMPLLSCHLLSPAGLCSVMSTFKGADTHLQGPVGMIASGQGGAQPAPARWAAKASPALFSGGLVVASRAAGRPGSLPAGPRIALKGIGFPSACGVHELIGGRAVEGHIRGRN